ncbi:MAG: HD-GYP domain-containing protein [Halanaerobiales bacterium]|nr:HD-GYP domain-containing protein [Halanaerobiales bacterium]
MRKIKKIPVAQVRVGMKIAQAIYSKLGTIIIKKDSNLEFHQLKRLRSLGISTIAIYINKTEPQQPTLKTIGYTTIMKEVQSFLTQVKEGKKVELSAMTNIVEGIREMKRNKDVIHCLTENFQPEYYLYSHTLNVALLAMLIGKWMKIPEKKITKLVYAGILHDIGKLMIDPKILNKPGQLDSEEFEEIKKHSTYGFKMVQELKFLSNDIKSGILFHHERNDGSGYPQGLQGDQIPKIAKIIAIADIFDAMTSKRVYSEEESPFKVLKLMEDQSYGKLDLEITRTLLSNIASYYVGYHVTLNNGEKGEIIFINPSRVSRPIIKTETGFVDLSMKDDLEIVKMSGSGKSEQTG